MTTRFTIATRTTLVAAAFAFATHANAQATSDTSVTNVINRLFAAMQKSDSAGARAEFIPGARVRPTPASLAPTAQATGLSVDQFVSFVAGNAPGSWIERMWSPVVNVSGGLAHVWFEYDIYRNGTQTQCGANSVQLQSTPAGWRIVSMTFSALPTGCTQHPPPRQ